MAAGFSSAPAPRPRQGFARQRFPVGLRKEAANEKCDFKDLFKWKGVTSVTEPAGKVLRLQRVMLVSSNIDRAREFYGNLLGLPCVYDDDNDLEFQVDGGPTIMIHGSDSSSSSVARDGARVSIYLEVDDVDALAARLRRAGYGVTGPSDEPWGERIAYVLDPDGYSISLSQLK